MKKLVSVFLVLILIFGLVACGKNENTPQQTTEVSPNTTNNISTIKVTIPEGYTLLRIAWLLEEKGFCTAEEFVEATQTANQWLDLEAYPFLDGAFDAENVCFYLEGYIYPFTYEIPEGTDVKSIIKMFLNGTKKVYNSDLLERAKKSGYTFHEILTMASVIEKEAFLDEQRVTISSVLHNRLKKGMGFQCDVTINYCEGVIKVYYPEKFEELKKYYNTYTCKGLMAGPICNPSIESINAAIEPAESDYLYFIVGTVPPYEAKYSVTFEEHKAFWAENKDRLTGKE